MFASVLAYNSHILELNLSGNELDDTAATALCEGYDFPIVLKETLLTHCRLRHNQSLQVFRLDGSVDTPKITGELCHRLCSGISGHSSIRHLSFAFQRLRNSVSARQRARSAVLTARCRVCAPSAGAYGRVRPSKSSTCETTGSAAKAHSCCARSCRASSGRCHRAPSSSICATISSASSAQARCGA